MEQAWYKDSFSKHLLTYRLFLLVLTVLASVDFSCVKYERLGEVKSPAYLRVFNDLTYTYNPVTKNSPLPFLVFLMDPVKGADSIPMGGRIIGDFLDTRELYNISYPAHAGDKGKVRNFEYPGSAVVLTAPVISGLDLSAWAQIPSGKHQIMFLTRPLTDTPFIKLSSKARSGIIVDTTIDFSPSEVYTLEALNLDQFGKKISIVARKENFIHQKFSDQYDYFSFYNFSAANLSADALGFSPLFRDTLNIYMSAKTTVCYNSSDPNQPPVACGSQPLANVNNVFITTVFRNYNTNYHYDSVQIFPRSQFLNPDGTYKVGSNRPFVQFNCYKPGDRPDENKSQFIVYCNDLFSDSSFTASRDTIVKRNGNFLLPAMQVSANDGQSTNPYGTINIFELVNNRIFMMQIQRIFNTPSIVN